MTKKRKSDFKRNKFPIHVKFGEPFHVDKSMDVDTAEKELRRRLIELLHQVQNEYPDSHEGQWWAPVRLGGTAPTPEQVQLEWEAHQREKEQK